LGEIVVYTASHRVVFLWPGERRRIWAIWAMNKMKLKIRDHKFTSTRPILEKIVSIVESYSMPITSRQIFYRLVSLGIIENNISGYRKVCGICSNARYAGLIDWDDILDDTRGAYKTPDWPDIETAVKNQIDEFRLDRWKESEYYIEVFVEKRGMVNTFFPITNKYDVRVVACGGWDSTANVWDQACRFMEKQNQGKKNIVLYFGDFDPSGDYMHETVEKRLGEFGVKLEMKRILLNIEHVQIYDLPVKFKVMAKRKDGKSYDKLRADPRAKNFEEKYGELMQVEIDAMDPPVLNEYLENSISEYLDVAAFMDSLKREEAEKKEMVENIRLMPNKKPVATRKGTRVEKLCSDELKTDGYLTWKTIRVRYQNIDLFCLFDVAALHPDGNELLLIQCKSTRCDNGTRRKIAKLKTPAGVKNMIWIRKHGYWIKESYD